VFSRDCPDYRIELPDGGQLTVLVNHFQGKLGGGAAANTKRRRQTVRTAHIYEPHRRRERRRLMASSHGFGRPLSRS
jgi:hypothetical protein